VGNRRPGRLGQDRLFTLSLCRALRDKYQLGVVTNDIYTEEDAQFLVKNGALAPSASSASRPAAARHTAISRGRLDQSRGVARLNRRFRDLDIIFIESGGDNLAATFSPSSRPDAVRDRRRRRRQNPKKGGPGIMKSDLLVIKQNRPRAAGRASLEVMARDSKKMRGERPFVFTNLKTGQGLDTIIEFIRRQGLCSEPAAQRLAGAAGGGIPRWG